MCGKVIVATDTSQLHQLKQLYERGLTNSIEDIRIIDDEQLREIEPYCRGIAAIKVGSAGIVNFQSVCRKLAELIREDGGNIILNEELMAVRTEDDHFNISTTTSTFTTRSLINCGGLQADRIAKMAGHKPDLKIIPFRGEYYKLKDDARSKVNGLIYPLPDENFPFLGVHCTKTVHGEVECGPNAVLSLARESYSKWGFRFSDSWDTFTYKGFQKLASQYWKIGMEEMKRSYSKKSFTKAIQELIPEIVSEDLIPHTPGIRATAISPDGKMLDDFEFISSENQLHVLSAPSPAATSSLKLGEEIARKALREFNFESIKQEAS